MTIDILNCYRRWMLNQCSIDVLVVAPLTSLWTVCEQSINFWSMHMSWPTLGWLSTNCWSTVDQVPTEYLIEMSLEHWLKYRWSVNRVSTEYRSRCQNRSMVSIGGIDRHSTADKISTNYPLCYASINVNIISCYQWFENITQGSKHSSSPTPGASESFHLAN